MRTLYNTTNEDGNAVIGEYTNIGDTATCIILDTTEANNLVASGSAILYETQDLMYATVQYRSNRNDSYLDIGEQLDMIYHELTESGSLSVSGSWAKSIKSVKDANPKP